MRVIRLLETGEDLREKGGGEEDLGEGVEGRGAAELDGGLDEQLDEVGDGAAGFAPWLGGEEGAEDGEEGGALVEDGLGREVDVGFGDGEGFAEGFVGGVVEGEEVGC